MAEHLNHEFYLSLLKSELIPALGCTEPIAVALAGAKARQTLGSFPRQLRIHCSGNVIKNAMGVVVPNSGGRKGIPVAAALGIAGGDANVGLQVLSGVGQQEIAQALELLESGGVTCEIVPEKVGLYIRIDVEAGGETASVTVEKTHTNITRVTKNGEILLNIPVEESADAASDYRGMSLEGILEFAAAVPLELLEQVIGPQIEMNTAISNEGLRGRYGAQVGRTLMELSGDSTWDRARARAAAGSDARMSGCTMPVVINSGSGNQGLTASMPVIEYAEALGADRETLCRALAVSNLTAIYQKKQIGSLSAYCGAVCAACGAGAAITYLHGGSYEAISNTVINTLADSSGMICDGAKPSCAKKIATALESAIMAHALSMRGLTFQAGEGILKQGADATIACVGRVAKVGMRETDMVILNAMKDGV